MILLRATISRCGTAHVAKLGLRTGLGPMSQRTAAVAFLSTSAARRNKNALKNIQAEPLHSRM